MIRKLLSGRTKRNTQAPAIEEVEPSFHGKQDIIAKLEKEEHEKSDTRKTEKKFGGTEPGSYDGPVTIQYSGVKIRGIRITGPEQDSMRRPWRVPTSSPTYTRLNNDNSKAMDIVKFYFYKWKSKSIYQTLLLFRAKTYLELSNFSQQVHLYNVHVFSTMTACKSNEYVELENVGRKLRYEQFIGEPQPIILRMPFVLNHRSNFYSEKLGSYDPDPYSDKRQIFKEDKDWITLIKTYTKIPRQQFFPQYNNQIKNAHKIGEADDPEKEQDEPISTEKKRFMGRDSMRSLTVYSIELPQTPEKLLGDNYGKTQGINLSKTLMQYMCPSCCGGLFSEPKGSVYTKRQRGARPSETPSMDTIISVEMLADKSDRYAEFSSSVDMHRQMAQGSVIMEDVNESQLEDEEVENHDNSGSATTGIEHHQSAIEQNSNSQTHFSDDKHHSKIEERKLQRNATIREELHMYSKELTERVNNEMNNESDESGEIKWGNILRKTSYPNNEVTDDTIVELKIAGKDHVEVRKQNGDSEAPFDFQAFLRKTNSTRQSLRRFSDISTKFADGNFVIAELLPNVILEGIVYNL